jgi:glycosyltransferase involved in cell wall biosynthesis
MPGTPSLPFVSVVVPVLNGERTIKDCLVSLLRTDYPEERREILVVDNGSTDRTTEIVESFPVALLREERRGASAARNRAIEASRGETLAFTDADCMVSRGWLRELVGGFENEEVGVVAGEIVSYPPETPAERYAATRNPRWHLGTLNQPLSPWFASANSALRREVFDLVGLFDERLPEAGGCEDIDFAWRVFQSKRFKLVYRPKAVVFHRHRVTARGLFKQWRGYGRGQAILRRKHPKLLPWDWRRELEAYKDLCLTAFTLGRVALGSRLKGRGTADFSYHYLELVRKIGARIGFTSGMLRRV